MTPEMSRQFGRTWFEASRVGGAVVPGGRGVLVACEAPGDGERLGAMSKCPSTINPLKTVDLEPEYIK